MTLALFLSVVLCSACTPVPQAASSGSLRTLTYNVHGLPPGITGDDTPARMTQIAPLLTDYDLLGLQEDWQADNHETLTQNAVQPVVEWFDQVLDDTRFYGAGLTTLGPGTETLLIQQHYTQCNGVLDSSSDCLASKGFQLTRLDLGQAEIDVYVTHLDAGGGEDDAAARQAQVIELLAAMDDNSADRPVVFLGDTNLSGDDPQDTPLIEQLDAAGLRNACTEVGCAEPDRIDRILVRDGGGVVVTVDDWSVQAQFVDDQGVALSDHDAIAATLSWSVGELGG
ncbi:MAG: hypothetical protein GXP62_06920 [Oligoflexia bacterium]|nr:hypothetical protein [Oligoflexia bacterium]